MSRDIKCGDLPNRIIDSSREEKLEKFAAFALQGLLSHNGPRTQGWYGPAYAREAVRQAKHLLDELENCK